jgi:hypothetical protein
MYSHVITDLLSKTSSISGSQQERGISFSGSGTVPSLQSGVSPSTESWHQFQALCSIKHSAACMRASAGDVDCSDLCSEEVAKDPRIVEVARTLAANSIHVGLTPRTQLVAGWWA